MEKVATYVRVSNHSNSEQAVCNQVKRIRDYCEEKGYNVCDSASVIGDRKIAFQMLRKLLDSAKDNGIEKIVMASTNRIVGTVDELAEIKKAFVESGVEIETLDGSYEHGLCESNLVSSFLAKAAEEENSDDDVTVRAYLRFPTEEARNAFEENE